MTYHVVIAKKKKKKRYYLVNIVFWNKIAHSYGHHTYIMIVVNRINCAKSRIPVVHSLKYYHAEDSLKMLFVRCL